MSKHWLQKVQQYSWHYLLGVWSYLGWVGVSHCCFLIASGASEHFSNVGKLKYARAFVFYSSTIPWMGQFVLFCVGCPQISFISGLGVRKSVALLLALSCFIFNNNWRDLILICSVELWKAKSSKSRIIQILRVYPFMTLLFALMRLKATGISYLSHFIA